MVELAVLADVESELAYSEPRLQAVTAITATVSIPNR